MNTGCGSRILTPYKNDSYLHNAWWNSTNNINISIHNLSIFNLYLINAGYGSKFALPYLTHIVINNAFHDIWVILGAQILLLHPVFFSDLSILTIFPISTICVHFRKFGNFSNLSILIILGGIFCEVIVWRGFSGLFHKSKSKQSKRRARELNFKKF